MSPIAIKEIIQEAEQNNIIQGQLCEEILNNVEILVKDPESIKNREDLHEIALNPTEYTNKLKKQLEEQVWQDLKEQINSVCPDMSN